MTVSLLTTKLYIPPVRPELVSRPRLIEQVEAGLAYRLTLISAPAGFGKTTLLSDWARTHPANVAWVSLDEGDNDPARFWAYLVAALQTIHAGVGGELLAAAQSGQRPPTRASLATLINEIAAVVVGSKCYHVLVLDDYHVIDAPPVHDALAFLLDHLPPPARLILATREDPPLPLGRWRVRGQMAEVRAGDLRFTEEEAAAFLTQGMGLDLAPDEVATLAARTEGWGAGLQLAALSLQGQADRSAFIRAFAGDDRLVREYLVDEVLARQPEPVQHFLLQTAILERLCGPLCDAVMGERRVSESANQRISESANQRGGEAAGRRGGHDAVPGRTGQGTLEYLERANLFIVPLDGRRQWYRYHHLFAELLRYRLRREQADLIPELHRRASAWYERNGFPAEALSHALAADDVERAGGTSAAAHPASLVEPLSEREIEVLRLVAEGLSNREIALRLFLSPNTVRVHTHNIYGKLGVSSRTQAVARGRALGLLPLA